MTEEEIDEESTWKFCTLCGDVFDERELTHIIPMGPYPEKPTIWDLLGKDACEKCLPSTY